MLNFSGKANYIVQLQTNNSLVGFFCCSIEYYLSLLSEDTDRGVLLTWHSIRESYLSLLIALCCGETGNT